MTATISTLGSTHRCPSKRTWYALLLIVLFWALPAQGQVNWQSTGFFPGSDFDLLNNQGGIHSLVVDPLDRVWFQLWNTAYEVVDGADTTRYSAVFVFNSDGTQASFSPILSLTVDDTTVPFTAQNARGMSSLPGGDILLAYANQLFRVDYLTGEATHLFTGNANIGLATASDNGDVVVGHVVGTQPVFLLNDELELVSTPIPARAGVSRAYILSGDGNTIYIPELNLGQGRALHVYTKNESTGEFERQADLLPGIYGESVYRDGNILWIGGEDPLADSGFDSRVMYAYDMDDFSLVNTLAFSLTGNEGSGQNKLRGLAFDSSGEKAYLGLFSITAGTGLIQTFAPQATPTSREITFTVDMTYQIQDFGFNTETDGVSLRGGLTPLDWGSNTNALTRIDDTNLYTITLSFDQPEGTILEYKFYGFNDTDTSVGWEGGENSAVVLPPLGQNLVLPTVFFNGYVSSPDTREITFRVDMSGPIATGFFKPTEGDMLHIVGTFDEIVNSTAFAAGGYSGWDSLPGTLMQPESESSSVYSLTITLVGAEGFDFQYKFRVFPGNDREILNAGFEVLDVDDLFLNRQLFLPPDGVNLVLDIAEFGDPTEAPSAPLSIRDLNTYPFPLTTASDIGAHPLMGDTVTITGVIVARPLNSGLAGASMEGNPARVHFFVVDTLAVQEGKTGMYMHIVDSHWPRAAAFDRGDIVSITGQLTVFNNVIQYVPSADYVYHGSVTDTEFAHMAHLLNPVSAHPSDFNAAPGEDGRYSARLDVYSNVAFSYVTLPSVDVVFSDNSTLRPRMQVASGEGEEYAKMYTHDVSHRFRNDRENYATGFNMRRPSEGDEYIAPVVGSEVQLSGFVYFAAANWDGHWSDAGPAFSIVPWSDGFERTAEGTLVDVSGQAPVDLVVLSTPVVEVPDDVLPVVLTTDTDSPYVPGQPLTLTLSVGDSETPFINMLGIGFELYYDKDVFTMYAYEILDSFMDGAEEDDILLFENFGTDFDSFSFTRIAQVGGVSGSGPIVKFYFIVEDELETEVSYFDIHMIEILSAQGNYLDNAGQGVAVELIPFPVWPGDTNNDGVVDILDVLPLGIYFGQTGPARATGSVGWAPQRGIPFEPVEASFADANGDGVVNQNDLLPVGLNFGSMLSWEYPWLDWDDEPLLRQGTQGVARLSLPEGQSGDQHYISLTVDQGDVAELLGLATEWMITVDGIRITELTPHSQLLEEGRLLMERGARQTNPLHSYAVTRTAGMGAIPNEGIMLSAVLTYDTDIQSGAELVLTKVGVGTPDGDIQPQVRLDASWITSLEVHDMPLSYALQQNFPNPFNPTTMIRFALPEQSVVRLEVYNMLGQQVAVLAEGEMPAGWHSVNFNAAGLASGMYIYRLSAGGFVQSFKMTLLK